MELLPRDDLRSGATALRTGDFPIERVIFVKTRHALLFGADESNGQRGFFERRIIYKG